MLQILTQKVKRVEASKSSKTEMFNFAERFARISWISFNAEIFEQTLQSTKDLVQLQPSFSLTRTKYINISQIYIYIYIYQNILKFSNWATKKLSYFPLYWLFNRDCYNGVL